MTLSIHENKSYRLFPKNVICSSEKHKKTQQDLNVKRLPRKRKGYNKQKNDDLFVTDAKAVLDFYRSKSTSADL